MDTCIMNKKMAEEFLEKAETNAARHGIDFLENRLFGNYMIKTITNYANTSKNNIIIVDSRGREEPEASVLGSISNLILCQSKIPVQNYKLIHP